MTDAPSFVLKGDAVSEAQAHTLHTLETVAGLTNLSRHTILVYYKHGLVSPVGNPEQAGYLFNDEAIQMLRRIEHLRQVQGIALNGIKIIFHLMNEVEALRAELPASGGSALSANGAFHTSLGFQPQDRFMRSDER